MRVCAYVRARMFSVGGCRSMFDQAIRIRLHITHSFRHVDRRGPAHNQSTTIICTLKRAAAHNRIAYAYRPHVLVVVVCVHTHAVDLVAVLLVVPDLCVDQIE